MLAPEGGGLYGMGIAEVTAPLSPRWSVGLTAGGLRTGGGVWGLRDATLRGSWLAINRPDLIISVNPALMLPLGSVPGGLGSLAPLSTGSVDPVLGADLVWGGAWLLNVAGEARVPVYGGFNGFREGPTLDGAVRGARRVGEVSVVHAGLSTFRRSPGETGSGYLLELAATAGAVFNVGEDWSMDLNLRVPLYGLPDPPYPVALGLGVTGVLGDRRVEGQD